MASEADHEREAAQVSKDGREPSEEAMLFCPVCDNKLISRRCKLICERCGYFMSCADYY